MLFNLAVYNWIYKRVIPFFAFKNKNSQQALNYKQRAAYSYNIQLDKSIHFHAASIGEVRIITSLVKRLQQEYPIDLVITCHTAHAVAQASQLTPYAYYAPLELKEQIIEFINNTKPLVSIVVENDVWPLWQSILKTQQVPRLIINGKLSQKSFNRLKSFKLWRQTMTNFDLIVAQDQLAAQQYQQLGANVIVAGNLKFTKALASQQAHPLLEQLSKLLVNYTKSQTLVVGSAYSQDIKLALEWLQQDSNYRLVIAPRDLNYIQQLIPIITELNLTWQLLSTVKQLTNAVDSRILIVDTFGDLAQLYGLAKVNLLGGCFAQIGGHDPLEIVAWGNILLLGDNPFKIQHSLDLIKHYHLLTQEEGLQQLSQIFKDQETDQSGALALQAMQQLQDTILHSYLQAITSYLPGDL